MKNFSLAILCDYAEEDWPSMEVVADGLIRGLERFHGSPPGKKNELPIAGPAVQPVRVCPGFRRRLMRLPGLGGRGAARNADRLINRMWDYPRHARRRVAGRFDLYHLADHSYSQLLHVLPAERAGVFCHDLDTFRCLLEPHLEPRPRWFRAMASHILRGMQKAAVVFYSTSPVRQQIEHLGLIDTGRLVHAPYGIPDEYTPESDKPDSSPGLLHERFTGRPFLLHVGSCIPRKRIDVLLDVFAAVRARRSELHLVQVGGEWTDPQREQLQRLRVAADVTQLRGLTREQVASLYRAAAVVLQPSEAEGFGLPVVEALACGAIVVASDIPVLREVGGTATTYCPMGDVGAWVAAVERMLDDPAVAPPRVERLAWASRYSWAAHARTIANSYLALLGNATLS
jgi:glycosyltransferase involved in cell wall biosynthesis